MKTRIKLALGVVLAALAIMAASQTVDPKLRGKEEKGQAPCYTQDEVELLMKANGWTAGQAKTILDIACQYSRVH